MGEKISPEIQLFIKDNISEIKEELFKARENLGKDIHASREHATKAANTARNTSLGILGTIVILLTLFSYIKFDDFVVNRITTQIDLLSQEIVSDAKKSYNGGRP